MARTCKIKPTLNCDRLEIMRKGFATQKDIKKIMPITKAEADKVYREISRDILLREGREVGTWGIEVDRVLKYFHLKEETIRRHAQEEREALKGGNIE